MSSIVRGASGRTSLRRGSLALRTSRAGLANRACGHRPPGQHHRAVAVYATSPDGDRSDPMGVSVRWAGTIAVELAGAVVGCGDHPAAIPDRAGTDTVIAPTPPPRHDNVGTGRLRGTRFAVPPVVSIYPCHHPVKPRRARDCNAATYAVFVRLTRDIPRRPSEMIAARFDVDGLDEGGPIGRQSRPKFCFEQSLGSSGYQSAGVPTRPGARVTLTLTAYDHHGRPDGELATSVRLRLGRHHHSANDISPLSEQSAVGC